MEYVILFLVVVCVVMAHFLVKLSKAILEMRVLLVKALNSAESAFLQIQDQASAASLGAEDVNEALNKISKRAYAEKIIIKTIKGAFNDTTANS